MKVGAPENRIELALGLILTPRLKTSTTGIWIGRHRSRALYPKTGNSQAFRISRLRFFQIGFQESWSRRTNISPGTSSFKLTLEEI